MLAPRPLPDRRRVHPLACWLPLLSGLLAAYAPPASALDPDKAFHHYVHNHWGVEQGLPQLSVVAIAQDAPGYLWFGTQAGLSRFDGVRFTNHDRDNTPALPSTWIRALRGDADGRLWIGTPQGLVVHREERFAPVELAADQAPGVVDVAALEIDGEGRLVVAAAHRGVMVVEQERLRLLQPLAGDSALSLLDDGAGALWVGGRGRVHAVHAGRLRTLPLPADAATATVDALALESGRLYAGSSHGLFRLDGDRWQRHPDPALSHAQVRAMKTDRDGNLWIATRGALHRVRDGRTRERIPATDSLQAIVAMFEDREANLWLGSYINGVNRVWNGWTRRYSSAEGLSNPLLWALAAGPDGRIWVAGEDGVSVLHAGRFRRVVDGRALPSAAAYSLLPEADGTWIGTRGGAALYRDGRLQPVPALRAMDAAQINGMLRDRGGRLWFATSLGLFRLDDAGVLTRFAEAAGLPDPRTRVLLETRDGRLLAGTQSGLFEFRDGRLYPVPMDGTGLDAPYITALHELPGGQLLAGLLSEEELLLFDGQRWGRLGRAQGLPVNAPFFIDHDADGQLWIGGLRGIYRLAIADLLAAAGDPLHRLGPQTLLNERGDRHGGQKGDCCNGAGNSRGILRDGTLWLPSRDGVVTMDTRQQFANDYVPESVIERVQVGSQWRQADPDADWALPRDARDLRFEFTTLSFQAADHIDIRYRLRGYSDQWRLLEDPGQRSATYTNLPAGRYVFEVLGTNNSGVSSRSIARLPFSIAPRFYESAWFYALLAIGLLALVSLSNRWMLRRHRRQRAILEEQVQQRTRDLQLANQRLETLSLTDPLTGLYNRRYLSRQLPLDLADDQRSGSFGGGDAAAVLILLDIDHFKSINDSHGHQAGDRILQQVSALFRQLTREGDYVARWGGEEFLLVFRPMPRSDVHALGRRICAAIAGHAFDVGQGRLPVTASLGIVEYPLFAAAPDLFGWEPLVSLADRALYEVKAHGRNGWAGYRVCGPPPAPGDVEPLRHDPAALIRRGTLALDGPHHPPPPLS